VCEASDGRARRLSKQTQAVEVDDHFLSPQRLQNLSGLGEEPVGGKAVEVSQVPESTKGDAALAPFVAPEHGSLEGHLGALLDVPESKPTGSTGAPEDLADDLVEAFQLGHPHLPQPLTKTRNVSRDYEGCTHNWISTSR
jgi:hypothetical protein